MGPLLAAAPLLTAIGGVASAGASLFSKPKAQSAPAPQLPTLAAAPAAPTTVTEAGDTKEKLRAEQASTRRSAKRSRVRANNESNNNTSLLGLTSSGASTDASRKRITLG